MILDFETVRKILPQAFPFIMIDCVEQIEEKQSIIAIKNVTGNEIYFQGHFPDHAIFPGVLLIEAMAQASIILFQNGEIKKETENSLFLLGTANAKLLKPVVPGNQVVIKVNVLKILTASAMVDAQCFVNESLVAKAQLSFAKKQRNNSDASGEHLQ